MSEIEMQEPMVNESHGSSFAASSADLESQMNEPLLLKKCASTVEAPFSLQGFVAALERPLRRYETFALSNGRVVESLESGLRSLCYFLPGRFKDAEFVSETLFALLGLFRYYNDELFGRTGRSMSLHQRNLLAYFNHLKSRHPLLKTLLAVLNVMKLVQVPTELFVHKFMSRGWRNGLILSIELAKFVVKLGLWQGGGWRPVPKHLHVAIEGREESQFSEDCSQRDPLDRLNAKFAAFDLKLRTGAQDLGSVRSAVHAYLKGHKHDQFTSNPQLSFTPTGGWMAWSRELAHMARPPLYVLLLILAGKRNGTGMKDVARSWSPLLASFALDLYSKWPELSDPSRLKDLPTLEAEERARRLLDFFYYFLRSPLYTSLSSPVLDSVEAKAGQLTLLRPLVETLRIYRGLCENIYFYTPARLLPLLVPINQRTGAAFQMDTENGQVSSLLAALRPSIPAELQAQFDELYVLYEKKLWYQLTVTVEALFASGLVPAAVLVGLFRQFVELWAKKMNQLSYTKLSVRAAELLDPKEAIELLEGLAEMIKKEAANESSLPGSYLLARAEAAQYYMQLEGASGTRARDYIDECIELLESMPVSPAAEIQASVYRISSLHDKMGANYSTFYRHTMLHLACLSGESQVRSEKAAMLAKSLSEAKRVELAHDLCVAALLSDELYNFGELLEHPILDALAGTHYEFLGHLIAAFNSGQLEIYVSEAAPLFQATKSHPALTGRLPFLQEKLCLMTLAQVLFEQLKHSRRVAFGVISGATHVPLDQVEFLLIRAISCQIIRGQIDQVAGEIAVTWIQPRVLDDAQLAELLEALRTWSGKVAKSLDMIKDMQPTITAAGPV